MSGIDRQLLMRPFPQVSGRIVIDAFAYYRSCNIVKPDLRSLLDDGETIPESPTRKSSILEGPEQMAAAMNETVSRCEDLRSLTDEHCLLATPWLKGMDLKTKEWGKKLDFPSIGMTGCAE